MSVELTDARDTTRDGHGVEEQRLLINEQGESDEHGQDEDTEEVDGSGESNEGHRDDWATIKSKV